MSALVQQIEEAFKRMDMSEFHEDVRRRLRWGGRCRCADCERLRLAGSAGLDGVHPSENQGLNCGVGK